MPRLSAEALAGAAMRAGGRSPEPPAALSAGAKARWKAIVECRAPDYFQAGSLDLLALFCLHAEAAYRAGIQLQKTPDDVEMHRRMNSDSQRAASLAIKLRITTSAEHGGRQSADQGVKNEPGHKIDGLLGGRGLADIETRRRDRGH